MDRIKSSKTNAEEWLDERFAKDPELKKRVDEQIAKLDLEDQLVALREARGLSQSALAKVIGVSQPRIAQLETSGANVELKTLLRYVTALGGSVKITVHKRAATGKVVGMRRARVTA